MNRLCFLAFVVVFPFSRLALSDLILNGSFEDPAVTNVAGFERYFAGSSIGAWNVDSGSVDLTTSLILNAAQGNQAIDLSGNVGDFGAISQDVTTNAGNLYTLNFSYAGNISSGPTVKEFAVFWGNTGSSLTQIGSYAFDTTGRSSTDMGYLNGSITNLVATSGSSRLQFVSLTDSGFGIELDAVSLTAVPEPSSLVLISLGAVGYVVWSRKRGRRNGNNG